MAQTINLSTRIPQPSVQFLDPNGAISREWLYYMIALLNRTGGDLGISSAVIQTQVGSQAASATMDDIAFPPPGPGLGLADVFGDDVPRSQANPFLAALMIADAA